MFDYMMDHPPTEGLTVEHRSAPAADTDGEAAGPSVSAADYGEQAPASGNGTGGDNSGGPWDGSWLAAYMSGYQKQRQQVYDRVRRLVGGPDVFARSLAERRDAEDAKAEAGLVRAQAGISRSQGDQLGWLKTLIHNGGAARFGYRNPVDMTAALLDVHRETAKDLVYLAERISDYTIGQIREGRLSYVRVLEETRLREAGATFEQIEQTRRFDLGRVRRFWQKLRKMTRTDEKKIFNSQYVSFQPSLDGSHYRMSGMLGGYEGEICRKALEQRADKVIPPNIEEGRPDAGLRRALALTTLCQDELDQTSPSTGQTSAGADSNGGWAETDETEWAGRNAADHADETDETIRSDGYTPAATPHPPRPAETPDPAGRNRREPLLMVVADQFLAEQSGCEQGVNMLAGPRVGPGTVDLIQCTGRTEHITITPDDITSRRTARQIRPGLRRAVLARDDGCTIDGCYNTYRLQVHHITPRSQGGGNTPGNLATLCWYHHHAAIHRQGLQLDPRSPPHRRRLIRPRPAERHHPPPSLLAHLLKAG